MIGVTAKLRGQSIGEERRDLPACSGAANRKLDGFIGNLIEQSGEGALPR